MHYRTCQSPNKIAAVSESVSDCPGTNIISPSFITIGRSEKNLAANSHKRSTYVPIYFYRPLP